MIIYEDDNYRITKNNKFNTIEVWKTYDNLSIDSVIYSELLDINRKNEIPKYIKEIMIKEKIWRCLKWKL